MSIAITIAEKIATRLNAAESLAGVEAVVERQQNVQAVVDRNIAKAKGAAIIITFTGLTNPEGNLSGRQSVTRNYTATIYTLPILRSEAIPADEIVELTARLLHDWEIDEEFPQGEATEIRVINGDLVPDRKYLIYEIDLQVLSRL